MAIQYSSSSEASAKLNEADVQVKYEAIFHGSHGKCVVGIPDIVTNRFLIEIKRVTLWKAAMGQLMAYHKFFPDLRLVVILFGTHGIRFDVPAMIEVLSEMDIEVIFDNEDDTNYTTFPLADYPPLDRSINGLIDRDLIDTTIVDNEVATPEALRRMLHKINARITRLTHRLGDTDLLTTDEQSAFFLGLRTATKGINPIIDACEDNNYEVHVAATFLKEHIEYIDIVGELKPHRSDEPDDPVKPYATYRDINKLVAGWFGKRKDVTLSDTQAIVRTKLIEMGATAVARLPGGMRYYGVTLIEEGLSA